MDHHHPQGNLSNSMRTNYQQHGVDEYYRKVNASYRNPFYPGIRKVITVILDRWMEMERSAAWRGEASGIGTDVPLEPLRILDLAAGSGEATLAVEAWRELRGGAAPTDVKRQQPGVSKGLPPPSTIPHTGSGTPGLTNPLASLATFRPPSSQARPAFVPPQRRPPGTAEASRSVTVGQASSATARGLGTLVTASSRGVVHRVPPVQIVATDPFTAPAYAERTGKDCLELSFRDVADGRLPGPAATEEGSDDDEGGVYDIAVCSFALHLVQESSELFALLDELSRRAKWLVVLAPHKKPEIKDNWGYERWDVKSWSGSGGDGDEEEAGVEGTAGGVEGMSVNGEVVFDRVRCRVYRSRGL